MEMESAAAGFVSPHSSLSRIPPGTVSAAGTGVPVVQSSSSTIETSRSADVNVDANNVATNEGSASVDAIASTSSGSTKTGTALSTEGNSWLCYADLLSDSYPAKSKMVYLKAYKLFERFLKSKNQWVRNSVPTDLMVLNYFHYLRHDLKWAPTTLWSTYARINAVMKRVFGVSLKSYTRVADVLKSYDSGYTVKKAGVFTPQQIEDLVTDPQLSSKYWLVRKAVCLIGYYGGFRNKELKGLKFENCELDNMGYWFHFDCCKQRGRLEETSICVPRRQPDWIPVSTDSSRVGLDFDPASLIDLYLAEVQSDLQCTREELRGDFFRATHGAKGQKFTKLPLGKNTIGRVGIQVATELCLPRPEIYTGHCWRRSCGTSASDSGVNVTTLMGMMGWSNPKTAMVYVKKSRMTSLSLSLYLSNVQRSNVANPFPRSPIEKRQAVKSVHSSKTVVAKCSNTLADSSCNSTLPRLNPVSGLKLEDLEVELATQDLIRDIEADEALERQAFDGEIEVVERVVEPPLSDSAFPVVKSAQGREKICEANGGEGSVRTESLPISELLPQVDPRMASILHNLQNTGNMTIHFHFDGKQK